MHRSALLSLSAIACLLTPATSPAESITSAPGSSTPAQVRDGEHEGLWNRSSLVDWIAGIGNETSPFDELQSVKSFEQLQRSIEEVKQMVLTDARTEEEAVEGLRMILKHLASSTNDSINTDFRNPLFAKQDPRNRDIGAYNPDAEYDQAFIDGRYDYKLSGNVGTVPYLSITVNGSSPDKLSELVAYLDDAAIRRDVDPEGNYTLWLTREKPQAPGGWVALPDSANGVVIRQYVGDRTRDQLATFAIEAVGEPLPNVETVSDSEMALRFANTTAYLVVSSTWHRTLLPQMLEAPNAFVPSTASAIGASAANEENYYQMAHYQLGEGEALAIDFMPPDTVYWNLTSATLWHESHRYLTDPVTMTSSEARKNPDGSVRFVLARDDPGHPNWLKTFGHERGFLILRMVGVKQHPLPKVTRAPVATFSGRP